MHAAGTVELDGDRFGLPAAHAQVLAAEGGPFFMAGAFELTYGYLQPIDRLIEAFRSGGGVPQSAYPRETWDGMCRFSRPFYNHLLVQQWIPAIDGLAERLEHGARWADVGCGAGHALIRLAEAYPNSTFVGYDQLDRQLELARSAATDAGVAAPVRLELADGVNGIPERVERISTF